MDREGYLNSEGSALRHCYYRILGFREHAKAAQDPKQADYAQHYQTLEEKYKTVRQALKSLEKQKAADEKTWREEKKQFRAQLNELEHEIVSATADLSE